MENHNHKTLGKINIVLELEQDNKYFILSYVISDKEVNYFVLFGREKDIWNMSFTKVFPGFLERYEIIERQNEAVQFFNEIVKASEHVNLEKIEKI